MERGHGCPARANFSNRVRRTSPLEHPFAVGAFLLFRALPDHARKTFQRHQRLAAVGPFLQFLDRDVIERLPPGAAGKQRARDVDHVWRARAFVEQRRAAMRAEMARGALVLVARDRRLAFGDTETLASTANIVRIRRAMRAAACGRMVVPGPARRNVDLEADLSAQALA